MVGKIIHWALENPLVVLLLMAGLIIYGAMAFVNINVEAYPDPAPAIIEVVAKYPRAAAEEVERRVTIPLEVTLAGMPGLKYLRSKSLYGLSHFRCQFEYGIDYYKARQEVINRLQFPEDLPEGVQPFISPMSPTGEILRYVLRSPKDAQGRDIYTLNDLKALQDWFLERYFRLNNPRLVGVVSSGGTTKRYEIHPSPERMLARGITLQQLMDAVAKANITGSGDYLVLGHNVLNVRTNGLIGQGLDPARDKRVLTSKDPLEVVRFLRAEENRRVHEIRRITIASIDHGPIRVEDVVEGGPLRYEDDIGREGVVVSHLTRLGKVSLSTPKKNENGQVIRDQRGNVVWDDVEEMIQGVLMLRKGEESSPALKECEKLIRKLNQEAGLLLPGVKVEPYYDRADLIHVTTETVRENLLMGMALVVVILFMFLSNVRSALIVALNIPLALLFAFSVLFMRGKSANLLSIGAVDFGIIVDSSVIMVENIYRHMSSGEQTELTLKQRISLATKEVEKSLFYSTAIMVCAFLPLFTMQGPEGQIFGPMADTYAFALGGALLLALTVAPVLCRLFFTNLKPAPDNFFVRFLKRRYLANLARCLRFRWVTLFLMIGLLVGTLAMAPLLGREFMPELEEGNLWIRGTFPSNISLEASAEKADRARAILRKYPEVDAVMSQTGRPDDGTDPTSYYNVELFVPLKPRSQWPAVKEQTGWKAAVQGQRARTRLELIQELNNELERAVPGVDWNFSQNIRDNVMESLSGVKGDNSVKIIGPDLEELERLAEKYKSVLDNIHGIDNVGIFHIRGQPKLEFAPDKEKCKIWGASEADVQTVLEVAVGGTAFNKMIEGEKIFDITVRWPLSLRNSPDSILNIPVDVSNNQLTAAVAGTPQTRFTGATSSLAAAGFALAMPSPTGHMVATWNYLANTPKIPLKYLVSPLSDHGIDPNGKYIRPGASMISREQGQRLIAIMFSVRGRDLAGAVSEAQRKSRGLLPPSYQAVWSGEFGQMQDAEARLMWIIPISLGLIFALLYMAFHSFLDALLVFSNVAALSLGGVWALLMTGTNFSISAAVGFISIFGVAVMDGLLLISYFNQLRAQGLPLHDAIMQGAEKRVRPVMMTCLTAILGLLPAAFSTRIGAQTQQPLAIVVVGGMISTLFLTRYLMPVLYSFYGHREPPTSAASLGH
jgi:cobalt-zinc-cadmium resistance protein CzcA